MTAPGDTSDVWAVAWLLAIPAVVAGLFALTVLAVVGFGRHDRARPCGAIVVLGAKVLRGGVPSGAMRARVEKAASLYRRRVADLVVLSGGVGESPPAEAELMQRLIVELGVPASACILESNSTSTRENARYAAEILRCRGIDEVVLVSDGYHLLRARGLFHRQGIAAHPSPASLAGRDLGPRDVARYIVREVIGLWRDPRVLFAFRPRR